MNLLITGILILLLLGAIVFTCVIFTNAVEHIGCRLNLSQGAVGSLLAAVGTALPETLVPMVAIIGAYIFHTDMEAGHAIGIGAILGAPFLLGTLAFCVTGVAVYYYASKGKRSLDMPVSTSVMKRDMQYFMAVYFVAVSASFLPFLHLFWVKLLVALLLLSLYGVYVYLTLKDSNTCDICEEELDSLYLSKWFGDKTQVAFAQLGLCILAIIVLAHLFVEQIVHLSHTLHISPLILSLIIAPIATELPEKFNSIIWIRSNKDTLALGNITGAMVFQSSIPPAVGILLTPWVLEIPALISVALVYVAVILVYMNLHFNKNILKPWILVISGIFYVVYLVYLLVDIAKTQGG